jgi:hypothetical protein
MVLEILTADSMYIENMRTRDPTHKNTHACFPRSGKLLHYVVSQKIPFQDVNMTEKVTDKRREKQQTVLTPTALVLSSESSTEHHETTSGTNFSSTTLGGSRPCSSSARSAPCAVLWICGQQNGAGELTRRPRRSQQRGLSDLPSCWGRPAGWSRWAGCATR